MTWWCVSANCTLVCTGGVWGNGDVPPQKLDNFVFLKLESCNLVQHLLISITACYSAAFSL